MIKTELITLVNSMDMSAEHKQCAIDGINEIEAAILSPNFEEQYLEVQCDNIDRCTEKLKAPAIENLELHSQVHEWVHSWKEWAA